MYPVGPPSDRSPIDDRRERLSDTAMPLSTWLTRLNPFRSNGAHTERSTGNAPCNLDEIFAGNGASGEKHAINREESPEREEPSNREWLAALRDCDPEAIWALRNRLTRGLLVALRRASFRRRVPRRTEALAKKSAREAISTILADLEAFRNRTAPAGGERGRRGEDGAEKGPEKAVYESRFTTWAQKIAVHVAFTKLRRNG